MPSYSGSQGLDVELGDDSQVLSLPASSAPPRWRLVLRSGDERKSSIDGSVGGGLGLQRQREHRGQVRTAAAL